MYLPLSFPVFMHLSALFHIFSPNSPLKPSYFPQTQTSILRPLAGSLTPLKPTSYIFNPPTPKTPFKPSLNSLYLLPLTYTLICYTIIHIEKENTYLMQTRKIPYHIYDNPARSNSKYLVIHKSYDIYSEEVLKLIRSVQDFPVTLYQLFEAVEFCDSEECSENEGNWYIPLYYPSFTSYTNCVYSITTTNSIFRFGEYSSPLRYPVIHMKSVTNLLGTDIPKSSYEFRQRIRYVLYRKILYKSFDKLSSQVIRPYHQSITPNKVREIVDMHYPCDEDKFEFLNTDEQTIFTIIADTTESTVLTNSIIVM